MYVYVHKMLIPMGLISVHAGTSLVKIVLSAFSSVPDAILDSIVRFIRLIAAADEWLSYQ